MYTYRDIGSHQIGLVIGFRVMVEFIVRIRVQAWSGVTLCPCTFCCDPLQQMLGGGGDDSRNSKIYM